MKKRPFDFVKELFLNNTKKIFEQNKLLIDYSDKLIIWLVGFSIGGIAIIIANAKNINNQLNHCELKLILILLVISIISGICYRIFLYYFQMIHRNIEYFIETAFSNYDCMPTNASEVENMTDIRSLIFKLKNDFNEDSIYYQQNIDLIDKVDTTIKDSILQHLKTHYKELCEWADNDFKNGYEYAKDTIRKAYGLTDKAINKSFDKSNFNIQLKIFSWLSVISFTICCITFISVLLFFCINY